jgi:nucleotide-binding universal stress UspA family protein
MKILLAIDSSAPTQATVDEVSYWGADLIVVGSHGRRGITGLFMGSVSAAVAMHALCSVDVIRKREGEK